MVNRREIGTQQELLAADYLKKKGYDIYCMNFRCKTGEIDIIAKDGDYLVFCEVKYRATATYGYPEEAVDYYKQNTIRRVSQFYMLKNNIDMNTPVRFDVIAILGGKLKHIRNAF